MGEKEVEKKKSRTIRVDFSVRSHKEMSVVYDSEPKKTVSLGMLKEHWKIRNKDIFEKLILKELTPYIINCEWTLVHYVASDIGLDGTIEHYAGIRQKVRDHYLQLTYPTVRRLLDDRKVNHPYFILPNGPVEDYLSFDGERVTIRVRDLHFSIDEVNTLFKKPQKRTYVSGANEQQHRVDACERWIRKNVVNNPSSRPKTNRNVSKPLSWFNMAKNELAIEGVKITDRSFDSAWKEVAKNYPEMSKAGRRHGR